MPWTIDDLDTPAVLIDLDRVETNLKRAQDYANAHGLALRPHIKTHKIPELARRQLELGAVGITCQKLGEAEVMVDAGIDDILITFNLLGRSKLQRLVALARRTRLSVTLDNAVVAGEIDAAMREAGLRLPVLIECDTGAARCGVQSPEEAVELALVDPFGAPHTREWFVHPLYVQARSAGQEPLASSVQKFARMATSFGPISKPMPVASSAPRPMRYCKGS